MTETEWTRIVRNYMADRGSDQDLANGLMQSGMNEEDTINLMRALLWVSKDRCMERRNDIAAGLLLAISEVFTRKRQPAENP
jgi:hypothetical protein